MAASSTKPSDGRARLPIHDHSLSHQTLPLRTLPPLQLGEPCCRGYDPNSYFALSAPTLPFRNCFSILLPRCLGLHLTQTYISVSLLSTGRKIVMLLPEALTRCLCSLPSDFAAVVALSLCWLQFLPLCCSVYSCALTSPTSEFFLDTPCFLPIHLSSPLLKISPKESP